MAVSAVIVVAAACEVHQGLCCVLRDVGEAEGLRGPDDRLTVACGESRSGRRAAPAAMPAQTNASEAGVTPPQEVGSALATARLTAAPLIAWVGPMTMVGVLPEMGFCSEKTLYGGTVHG